MNKYSRRYIHERFGHETESVGMDDVIRMIDDMGPRDEYGLVSDAIHEEFRGLQRDYLQIKLLDKKYGVRGAE